MKKLLSKDKIRETDHFFDKIHHIEMNYLTFWKENTLWHWDFWLSFALTIMPWVLWFVFRKKGSEARLLLVGGFGIIVASWLDFIGVAFGIWHYSGKLLPTIPTFIPWDMCLIPVSLMFWVQYKPNLNSFLKAGIYSTLTSFIGEPIFEWIGLYSPEQWSSFYSFPIYAAIYFVADRISKSTAFDDLRK